MREWLKAAREDKGITSTEAAKFLGVSLPYYSMIESGLRKKTLDVATALRLSKLLGMTIEEVITNERASP